jgi:hypothetical protein
LRHGRTIIAGEVSILATLIAFVVAGTPLAIIVTLLGIVGTAVVGIIGTEREHRARTRLEAQIAPVRSAATRQVAVAALTLIRHAIVYRDVAAAQPRQRHTTIRELARGEIPDAGWSPNEARRIYEGIAERARVFHAEVGAGTSELDLELRGHVHEISELLPQALDDLNTVEYAANLIFDAGRLGQDDELARGRAILAKSAGVLRTRLQGVVARAEMLIAAGPPRAAAEPA